MIALACILFAFVRYSNQQTVDQLIEGYTQIVSQHKPDCIKESGADPVIIDDEILHGKLDNQRTTICFWRCFYQKLNLMNEKDEVIESNIKQYIGLANEETVDEIFEKCAHIRKPDACDTATGISRCVYSSVLAALRQPK